MTRWHIVLAATLLQVTFIPSARVQAEDATRVLQGRVSGGGHPLEGVCISDGHQVVQTDSDGNYRLPVGEASGRFVFVTLPRGFWTDDFYVPLSSAVEEGRADFQLTPMRQSERFDFVFLADMHLERGGTSIAKLKSSLKEINQLDPVPAFLLAQGDICLQSGVGDLYAECCRVATMPMRHGAGNHEIMLRHNNPRDDFERQFGPTYYSFDYGPLHCIVLDGNKPIPGETGWQAVHGAVEDRELEWLKADLAAQPKEKPIVVGVHIPIVSTYPERRNKSPENAPYWEMTNRKQLTDLFTRHGVRLVLQGHMHENERATIGGVEYVASISISGSWWKSGEGFERGVDNSPRGYRIVSVDGPKITHRYQPSCESRVERRGEFDDLDKPMTPGNATPFVFNCYDAPNESTVVARIDDGPWQPMTPFAKHSPTTPDLTMTHHFGWTADTTAWNAGRHVITVRVRFPDDQIVEESSSFLIAPTSRTTPPVHLDHGGADLSG